MSIILASDFTGIFEGMIWYGVHGFYGLMLLITFIGSVGRGYSRVSDDLTHALVWGGIALLFASWLLAWRLLDQRNPDWMTCVWHAAASAGMWAAAVLMRWRQRRL